MSGDGARCRSCGTENRPGRDFCERCGEYLAWAPTTFVAALPGSGMATEEVESSGAAVAASEPRAPDPPTPAAPAVTSSPVDDDPGAPPTTSEQEALAHEHGPPAGGGTLPYLPAAERASGDAALVLLPPVEALGSALVPALEAGATLTFEATIRNESHIVDNYDLTVLGLPEGWGVVWPAAAFLVPLGSGRGESEQRLRIDISPPRDHRSTAGIWTFELVALSRTSTAIAARAVGEFEVLPFQSWSVEVVPVVNSGRLKARYRTALRNDGNAEQVLWPATIDDSGRLRTKFDVGKLTLQAGEVGVDTLTLRPRIPRLVGRAAVHNVGVDALSTEPEADPAALSLKEKLVADAKAEARKTAGGVKVTSKGVTLPKRKLPKFKNPMSKFKIDASTLARLRGGDAAAPLAAKQVVFRQKPLIALWFIGLLLLLALVAVLIYLLLPRKTTVPPLVGVADAFLAEKKLRAAELVLRQPVQRRADPDAEAGSVIEQSPESGAEAKEGASVSIVIADGETKVDVPRLKGLTRVKADERLREDGLTLGETEPADAPDGFVVRSQIPDAGLSVDRGTAVRAFLTKPPPSRKQREAAKKKAAAAAAAKKKAAESVTIPEIDKRPVTEYGAALEKLKLKPRIEKSFSGTRAGAVIAVEPKPGEKARKGDEVRVSASAGLPPLAVQTLHRVVVLSPRGGRELGRLPLRSATAAEPAYLPDGEQVVYRSGLRIELASTRRRARPRVLYGGPDVLERPTPAPDGVTLAVIRREEDDGDLCFGRIDNPDLGHLCLPDDGWDLNGRLSWRRDGMAVLVPARRQDNPAIFAMRLYTTGTPFALDPLRWKGATATDITKSGKGVIAAAFSPGGTRIAAVSNLETDRFEAVLGDAADVALAEAKPTGAPACDVTWRPDGLELVVVRSDPLCNDPFGTIVRFATAAPDKRVVVRARGRNPAYQTG